jgi:hypothetical protein
VIGEVAILVLMILIVNIVIKWEAVAAGDASICDKISGKEFKQYGSNPPRDKCYMMVAADKGDYDLCKKVKGWEMSYSKDDCIFEVISKNDDPKGCDMIKDDDRQAECNETFRSANALVMKDQMIDDLTAQIKEDPENPELKAKLEQLMNSKKALFPYLSSDEQNSYVREYREKIMENIDDEEVKVSIAKEYNDYKKNNPDMDIITMMDKMKAISDRQQTLKEIDEDANQLVDAVKEQMMELAQQGQDAMTDAMKEKASEWIKENGWDSMKWSLQNLEWMKEKYDKASAEYQAINEKYEKLKATYDKVMGIYTQMDSFDTLVAQGKLTADKAKGTQRSSLLQNGLTAVTEYVPVFGSTVSKVTDATFGTAIKVAEERAKRTTALDKCIEDPLNCDTDGISAYYMIYGYWCEKIYLWCYQSLWWWWIFFGLT